MGGSLTKQKASSSSGKAKKAKVPGPGPAPAPPLPYLASGSTSAFGQDDYDAIYDYTTNKGYKIMNPYLRDPDGYVPASADADATAEAIQAHANKVSAALAKLPPRPGRTFRGSDFPKNVLNSYKEGAVVTERAFTSTSTDSRIGANKIFDGNAVMIIDGQSGRDISKYSQFPTEKEVLYDRGTKFLVTAKYFDPARNKWFISVEEAA